MTCYLVVNTSPYSDPEDRYHVYTEYLAAHRAVADLMEEDDRLFQKYKKEIEADLRASVRVLTFREWIAEQIVSDDFRNNEYDYEVHEVEWN